jgi:putative flippase GtrA
MSRTLLRAVVVGVGATLVDLGALWLLVNIFGWPPVAANVPALFVGVAAQFVGCKLFAFENRSPRLVQQGGQFALVEAGALVLNALLFHLFVTATTMPYPAARLLGSALVYFCYSYPLWRRIFERRERQG